MDFLKWIMDFLKCFMDNITDIKDILWIIFTVVATIVTILTYRGAKHTILLPLRTEVIKKQTDLIIEIMTVFTIEYFLSNLDFDRIVRINTYRVLKNYGYELKDNEKIEQEFNDHCILDIIVKRSEELEDFSLPEIFENQCETIHEKDYKKGLIENLKQGKIDIETISVTKNYHRFISKIDKLRKDAFLPIKIKEPMDTIIQNISNDIKFTLKQVLEDLVLEIYNKSQTK
ncbi:MAG: hypothetical protein WCN92_00450 [Eubacteriales bacterium]